MKKDRLLLLCIFLLALFLRFYQLGQNPPSLSWDEVAWGYNAYSLGIDGKDEFGRFLPVNYLESFGDFKPPVYAYLDILPVNLFGLNEFATRFPSAFFGTVTILIVYFLTKRIFFNSNSKFKISLAAAFILAISPWHINLSRAAFEANVATFFIISGVWLFLGGVQEKRWYLLVSTVLFILSIYTFNTARIVVPILVLTLAIIFRKQLVKRKKETILAIIIGILLILPTLKFLLSPQASLRFREVNIFSDPTIIERTNQQIENDKSAWWSKILHNRRFAYATEYVRHYFDNLTPGFLFIRGDGNPKFSTQDVGELYLWDLPFFILGILFLIRKKEGNWWVVPLWLLIGIIPAATARETPHALRIETTVPTFQVIIAYGLVVFLEAIANLKNQPFSFAQGKIAQIPIAYLIFSVFFLFLIFNFLYYIHGYYTHYPREYSGEWQYGYKESIAYVKEVQDQYDEVRITNSLGRPYMYYLFYTKTNPEVFRKTMRINRDVFGFVTVEGFLHYRFSHSLVSIKNKAKQVLYIDSPLLVPKKVKILKKFHLLNGETILVAYRK